jgi:tetratricopeptide (TPR) repeat protein
VASDSKCGGFNSGESGIDAQSAIFAQSFLDVVLPAVQAGDPALLAQAVRARWTNRQIATLLKHQRLDVRRVAAMALGFVGDPASVPALVRALRDTDPQVNQMAEHSLWSVWFRSGKRQALCSFKTGVKLLGEEKYLEAVMHLREAHRLDPDFAEALHQCAMAHFFVAQYDEALAACHEVIRRVPSHFGAIACLGHCHMQLGHFEQALRSYQRALEINPHMATIAAAVRRLNDGIVRQNDSSGYFQLAGA